MNVASGQVLSLTNYFFHNSLFPAHQSQTKYFRQTFRQIYLWPHQLQKRMTKTVTFAAGKTWTGELGTKNYDENPSQDRLKVNSFSVTASSSVQFSGLNSSGQLTWPASRPLLLTCVASHEVRIELTEDFARESSMKSFGFHSEQISLSTAALTDEYLWQPNRYTTLYPSLPVINSTIICFQGQTNTSAELEIRSK